MGFEQMTLFDYVDKNSDSIYQSIEKIEKDQEITFGECVVRKNNFGFYEIETEESHEVFTSSESCYCYIRRFIDLSEFRKSQNT